MVEKLFRKNTDEYCLPIPPSTIQKSEIKSKVGHLGLLVQTCANYAKEFDQIINLSKKVNIKITSTVDNVLCNRSTEKKRKLEDNYCQELINKKAKSIENDSNSRDFNQEKIETNISKLQICNWYSKNLDKICGKYLSSAEEFNEHVKLHTTAELVSDLSLYYQTRNTLENKEVFNISNFSNLINQISTKLN